MPNPSAPKRLITGPAGSGKTTSVLEAVRARIDADEEVLCLLPTYGQVEHTKRRFLGVVSQEAVLDPPFYTFTGLYELIFPERRVRRLASLMTRRRLMERAIGAADVPLFREVSDTAGFRERALAVVKEIRENGLDTAEIRDSIEAEFSRDGRAAERLLGFLDIARRYEAALDGSGEQDHEGALLEVLEGVESGKGPDLALLVVDGFANFTRIEFRLLEALVARSRGALVTLPGEIRRGSTLFRLSEDTRKGLLDLGFREEPSRATVRWRDVAPLRHVADSFSLPGAPRIPPGDRLRVIVGADRASEVEEIARAIDRLRRGLDLPTGMKAPGAREIGVIVRRLDEYRGLIPPIFRRHGVPVRISQDPLPLRSEPIVRHALAYLGAISGRLDVTAVLRHLGSNHVRAGATPFSPEDLARVRRAAAGMAEAVRQEGPPGDLAALLRMGSDGGREPQPVRRLKEHVLAAREDLGRKRPADEMSAAFQRHLAEGLATSFQAVSGAPPGESGSWYERFRQESAALSSLRRAIEDGGHALIWDDDEIEARDFHAAIEEAILDASAPVRDRRLDCVHVIDAREARHWESLRVVFVAGLLEQEFPVYPREDIFIRDAERQVINRRTSLRLREHLRQRDEERYLFYVAVTRASELLFCTHPGSRSDGEPTQRSFYLGDLLELFEEGSVREERVSLSRPWPEPGRAVTSGDLELAAAGALGSGDDAAGLALARTAPDPGLFAEGRRYLRTGGDPIRDPLLLEEVRRATRALSASSINSFHACPHRFFVGKLLGVDEPAPSAEQRLEAMEVGRIAHKVLERHLGADRDRPVEEIIDEEIAGDLREIDLGVRRDIVRRNLRSWLLFTLEREGRSGDPFRPVEHELPFVEEHRVAVPLGPDGDEEVILRGKIDRVDFAEIEGREVAIVVDYKTSRGFEGRDRQAIIDLDDVQLYVYALAAERRLDRRVVGAEIFPLKSSARGGVYRKEVEAILGGRVEVKKPVFLDEDEWEAFLVAGRERIAAVVKAMRAGEKARAPADPADCRSNRCPAFLVCRPDRWGMAARLRAAAREEES